MPSPPSVSSKRSGKTCRREPLVPKRCCCPILMGTKVHQPPTPDAEKRSLMPLSGASLCRRTREPRAASPRPRAGGLKDDRRRDFRLRSAPPRRPLGLPHPPRWRDKRALSKGRIRVWTHSIFACVREGENKPVGLHTYKKHSPSGWPRQRLPLFGPGHGHGPGRGHRAAEKEDACVAAVRFNSRRFCRRVARTAR